MCQFFFGDTVLVGKYDLKGNHEILGALQIPILISLERVTNTVKEN